MNIKRILLPVDFSHSSDAALSFASSLAADSKAQLTLLHVGENSPAYLAGYGGFSYTPEFHEKVVKENLTLLERIKPTIAGIEYKHEYLDGEPAEEILSFADRENVDLIVIGSHGRTGLSRLLLGSVAEAVVRGAKCPVLTVKQPTESIDEAEKTTSTTVPEPNRAGRAEPRTKFSLH